MFFVNCKKSYKRSIEKTEKSMNNSEMFCLIVFKAPIFV